MSKQEMVMPNMSYCRFENTLGDMRDCMYNLHEAAENGMSLEQFLQRLGSDYERRAFKEMEDVLLDMLAALDQMRENKGMTKEELEEFDAD
jgi:hypothetical protein